MISKRAPAGTRIAWAAEGELHSLKPSKVQASPLSARTTSTSSAAPPLVRADLHSAAREFALRIGADCRTPGVAEEVESFLKAPLPEGWQKFETTNGTFYYSHGETTQWEHPEEERLLKRLANVTSFPGSPLWVWQQRQAIKPERKKASLVRAWKRRPMIKAETAEEPSETSESVVEVEILKSGYPRLNFKLLKVFCKYFSVLPEEAARVSFLLKIAAVCPLPAHVRLEMKDDTCLFIGDGVYSTRHPCDNFFQVVFDGLAPDQLPATPVSKVGGLWFNWEKDDLVISDKPFMRRSLSRAFLSVIELINSRSEFLSSQTTLEMAYQGVCAQNVSLVLTALGEVVATVHDIAKRENRSSAHLSDDVNDASWPTVYRAALKTLKTLADFLSDTPAVVKSPRKISKSTPTRKISDTKAAPVVAFSMADSDDGEQEEEADEDDEDDENNACDECAVTFGGLDKAIQEYPPGAQLFVPELLEQLTTKELAGCVKFLEALVDAGNCELVKAMEERDDLNGELVELSKKINIFSYSV